MRQLILFVLLLGAWLFALRWFFTPDRAEFISGLTARQRAFVATPNSADALRLDANNPEWTLMGRTFTVLAFANLALSQPERRDEDLALIDTLIKRTIETEAKQGQRAFLLPYARVGTFHDPSGRSLFVDGELALMMAARQRVAASPELMPELQHRIDLITAQLSRAPNHLAESYPDEGWVFCNAIALAALRLADSVDGRSHEALRTAALESLKTRFVEPKTGLLISSFHADGTPRDGPEGSTLWLSLHMLQLVDADFARAQYTRARELLGHDALGFAWAGEWPSALRNHDDVDSGPTIPLLDANAGSSGLAFIGAAAFGDDAFLTGLTRSLWFAAFPTKENGALRFEAGNQLADAVAAVRARARPALRVGDGEQLMSRLAFLLLAAFAALHVGGGRACVSVLSGTSPGSVEAAWLGLAYALSFFAVVVCVPPLLATALFSRLSTTGLLSSAHAKPRPRRSSE